LSILDATNNFWGWTATAREVVRDDQWEEMADVYVRDKYDLGLQEWFEKENPHALAQTIERMLEAARQEYWNADPGTIQELRDRYQDLATRFDIRSDNARFLDYVADGESVDASQLPAETSQAPASDQPTQSTTQAPEAVMEQVTGMRLDQDSNQEI